MGTNIPQSNYYSLFKFFHDEHGLTLLDGELQDIIMEVERWKVEHEGSAVDRAVRVMENLYQKSVR